MHKHTFISYSRNDEEFVLFLYEELKKNKISVWLDQKDIPFGQNWDTETQNALDKCNNLIVVLSMSSVESRNVKDEIGFARSENKVIIPILYEECRVPFQLRMIQHIDFTKNYDNGLNQLLKVIKSTKKESTKKESTEDENNKIVILRNRGKKFLLPNEVKLCVKRYKFYCKEYDWNRDWANPTGQGINHIFKLSSDRLTVIDETTALQWQLGGSEDKISYKDAFLYVKELNANRFADFNDWRIPTVEEAMSLVEPYRGENDLYIDSMFEAKQDWIWTSDMLSVSQAWDLYFKEATCHFYSVEKPLYVRCVRTWSNTKLTAKSA